MKSSEVMWGALRIVHFEVKEDSGSLTFDQRASRKPISFSQWVRRAIFLA